MANILQKTKIRPYLAIGVLIFIYLIFTAYLEEGISLIDAVFTSEMTYVEFYLTFALVSVLWLTIIVISVRSFSITINWAVFAFVALLFVVDVVAIVSFPSVTIGSTSIYRLTADLRFRYIIDWLSCCMAFYVMFAVLPRVVFSERQLDFYFIGAIIIGLFAVLFSLIVEFQSYASFFNVSTSFSNYSSPVSFTNNKNTFGTLLMICVLCSGYLRVKKANIIWSFFSFFFFFETIIVSSKTAIFAETLFLLCLYSWLFVKEFKNHPLITVIRFLTFLILIVGAIVFVKNSELPFWNKLRQFLLSFFTSSGWLLEGRTDIWQSILTNIDSPVKLLFGTGDWNFSWYLGIISTNNGLKIESAHSGFFDVFGRLGLFGLCLYLALLVFFLRIIWNDFKKRRTTSFVRLLIFASIILHGLAEDTNFLNMQAKTMMVTFIAFVPTLVNWYSDKTQSEKSVPSSVDLYFGFQKTAISDEFKTKSNDVVIGVSFIFSFLIPIFSGFSSFFSVWYSFNLFTSPYSIVLFLLFALFVPVQIDNCFTLAELKKDHLRDIIVSISWVWAISCFVFAVFWPTILSFLFAFASAIVIICVTLKNIDWFHFRNTILIVAYFMLPFIANFVLDRTVVSSFLVPIRTYQPYAVLCLAMINTFISVFSVSLLLSFKFEKSAIYYLEWCYFMHFFRLSIKQDIACLRWYQKGDTLLEAGEKTR